MSETPAESTSTSGTTSTSSSQTTPATQAAPAQQAVGTEQPDALYSSADLAAAARSTFGCQPWDVVAIFSKKGVEQMTIPDFEAALQEWQQPIPVEGTN